MVKGVLCYSQLWMFLIKKDFQDEAFFSPFTFSLYF